MLWLYANKMTDKIQIISLKCNPSRFHTSQNITHHPNEHSSIKNRCGLHQN